MKPIRPPARKRFAQHFLQDAIVRNRILSAAAPAKGEHVLEIGPGRGALTANILEQGASLTAVEIDRDLAENLRRRYKNRRRLRLVQADILNCDWHGLVRTDRKNKIIANLPYNISTPLFFRMVRHRSLFDSMVIMVQKEVALRIRHTGKEGKLKEYGILSVIANTAFQTEWICEVPADCFFPIPQVASAVVRLTSKPVEMPNETAFFDFVKRAFNQRRKLLLSFLKRQEEGLLQRLPPESVARLSLLRPENLSPAQYCRLYHEHRI